MLKAVIIAICLIAFFETFGQKSKPKGLIESLMSNPHPIPDITSYNYLHRFYELPDAELPYIKGIHQFLVKGKSNLYMLVDGTGRVYKVEGYGKGSHFVRLDSTRFFGYNFGFIPFCYNDTIYSFGGYGFWKFNGQLREFIEKKGEWELAKLSAEISFAKSGMSFSTLYWYGLKERKLYIGYSLRNHEGIKNSTSNTRCDSAFMLNLESKEWIKLGLMNKIAQEKASDAENLPSSPWGQIIHSNLDDKFYLLNYRDNHISILNSEKSKEINQLISSESVLYFRDSTLFIGTSQSMSMDSISLHIIDFSALNEPLYYPLSKQSIFISSRENFPVLQIILIVLILLLITVIIIRERKFRGKPSLSLSKPNELIGTASKIFNEVEQEIIHQIQQNALYGRTTSIHEINKVLGVTQKSNDLQKKHRSDIIISVNKKFRFVTGSNDLLITKKRSDGDKRSFEYLIDFKKLNGIQEMIGVVGK